MTETLMLWAALTAIAVLVLKLIYYGVALYQSRKNGC